MGLRTLGVVLALLCVTTSVRVAASDTATNSSVDATASKNETVAQLLADVQTAVADDPALANMFDIQDASQMSEEELTALLQDLLDVSLSAESSGSTNTKSLDEEATSPSAADSTPSSATSPTVSAISAVCIVAALGAIW